MKTFLTFLFLSICCLYAKPEVIKLNIEFSSWTNNYMWPVLASGGIHIDEEAIYIPDQKSLYIQSRKNHMDKAIVEINVPGDDYFRIQKVLPTKTSYYFSFIAGDGRLYLYKRALSKNEYLGPISKHGNMGRILELPNGNILVGGEYRPNYANYLDLYDDETRGGPTELAITKFGQFYENQKAFTLTYYDKSLVVLDSANIIQRIGDNARMFSSLFVRHTMDVSGDGTVWLIDNDQGYFVEKYSVDNKPLVGFKINNPKFKPIAETMTTEINETYQETSNAYTQAYALYLKNKHVLTSFMSASADRGVPVPPYYYDICNLDGKHITSGQLDYPIICEDEQDKVFLLVRKDAGWFDDDELYLYGITLEDLLNGKANREFVARAISKYESSR